MLKRTYFSDISQKAYHVNNETLVAHFTDKVLVLRDPRSDNSALWLIASTTVRSYLRGLFLLVADRIYHCIPIPQSRIGYMKLSLGLKKLVWSCMLQCGSRGSRNQSLDKLFISHVKAGRGFYDMISYKLSLLTWHSCSHWNIARLEDKRLGNRIGIHLPAFTLTETERNDGLQYQGITA